MTFFYNIFPPRKMTISFHLKKTFFLLTPILCREWLWYMIWPLRLVRIWCCWSWIFISCLKTFISCLNFWGEAWRFLSLRIFRLLSFIFIVISTMFQLICLPAFFRCLLNSGTYMELKTTFFIVSMGITCSDSVRTESEQATLWIQTFEEGWRTYRPKRCGNNNKDEDNSLKTLNDRKLLFSGGIWHLQLIVFHQDTWCW